MRKERIRRLTPSEEDAVLAGITRDETLSDRICCPPLDLLEFKLERGDDLVKLISKLLEIQAAAGATITSGAKGHTR